MSEAADANEASGEAKESLIRVGRNQELAMQVQEPESGREGGLDRRGIGGGTGSSVLLKARRERRPSSAASPQASSASIR